MAADETKLRTLSNASAEEATRRLGLIDRLKTTSIPPNELIHNIGMFLSRQTLARVLFMNELYQKIIPVHGVIFEFGVRWGQNLSLFQSMRGMYEPFNYNRRIVGFDTFEGFPTTAEEDGAKVKPGDYAVVPHYEHELEALLDMMEKDSPLSHIRKFELVKGDATKTVHEYLMRQPETVVALAYFDFDIYSPTKVCLEAIRPHLTKGSVIAFDELNHPAFPGETVAVREVLGLDRYAIRRVPYNPLTSYVVVE